MLAGLMFAVQESDDRPGTLGATLPFAGMTLIEYQARLLIAAGVSQIVIVVARLTPELLGAVARIARRGVTVDAVRTASEASAKLHPLARLLVLADGLVSTDAIVAEAARQSGDMLFVVDEASAPVAFERIGGAMAWAGVARLDARRLAEVAGMPRDYDVQSALLHTANQAGVARRPLPSGAAPAGHGVERRGEALEARGMAVLDARLSMKRGWFDRWIVRPVTKQILPAAMRRNLSSTAIGVGTGAAGMAGLALIWAGQPGAGLIVAFIAVLGMRLWSALAWLRDEGGQARAAEGAALVLPALAALLLAWTIDGARGTVTAEIIALTLVAVAALETRAIGVDRRDWWGSAPAYLLVLLVFTVAGLPVVGLAAAAIYAFATLAAAIEQLRQP